MAQCKGTTKKGERCKIHTVGAVEYCHYHVSQGSNTKVQPVIARSKFEKPNIKSDKSGFIYLYTLANLMSNDSAKGSWLQIQKWNKSQLKLFNSKNQILIKVGCTTLSVSHRIKQWESQCGHKLTLINPYNTLEVLDPMTHLMRKFNKLRIVPEYENFLFQDLGFKCDKNVLGIEKQIHLILREIYGYGTVYCNGCSGGDKYKIHVEWFLVPRRDIGKVFKIIDKVIKQSK